MVTEQRAGCTEMVLCKSFYVTSMIPPAESEPLGYKGAPNVLRWYNSHTNKKIYNMSIMKIIGYRKHQGDSNNVLLRSKMNNDKQVKVVPALWQLRLNLAIHGSFHCAMPLPSHYQCHAALES